VGVIVLQQLAQVKQSTSGHTVLSIISATVSKFLGGFFSSLPKKRLNAFYCDALLI